MSYSQRDGYLDPQWMGQLDIIRKEMVGIPATDARAPILLILKRLTESSQNLLSSYQDPPFPSELARIDKVFKLAKVLNKALLTNTFMGRKVVEILAEGMKQTSNKKIQLFHMGLFHLFMFPQHLIYMLTPEWTWGGYRQEWDKYHGSETLNTGIRFAKNVFGVYQWYKKFLASITSPSVASKFVTTQDYFEFLTKGAAEKVVNEVAMYSLHLISLARSTSSADSGRRPNRKVI